MKWEKVELGLGTLSVAPWQTNVFIICWLRLITACYKNMCRNFLKDRCSSLDGNLLQRDSRGNIGFSRGMMARSKEEAWFILSKNQVQYLFRESWRMGLVGTGRAKSLDQKVTIYRGTKKITTDSKRSQHFPLLHAPLVLPLNLLRSRCWGLEGLPYQGRHATGPMSKCSFFYLSRSNNLDICWFVHFSKKSLLPNLMHSGVPLCWFATKAVIWSLPWQMHFWCWPLLDGQIC